MYNMAVNGGKIAIANDEAVVFFTAHKILTHTCSISESPEFREILKLYRSPAKSKDTGKFNIYMIDTYYEYFES